MDWIINNWSLIVVTIAVICVCVCAIIAFIKLPVVTQKQKIKEWLLWAVTECEKQMGSGTGKMKLRLVYDWFINTFKWVSKIVSFDTFSKWVDEALEQMCEMLSTNEAIAEYVSGENDE